MLLLALLSCATRTVAPSTPEPTDPPPTEVAESAEVAEVAEVADVPDGPAVAGVDHPALRRILHEAWETTMETWPTWATSLGDHRYDDRLGDPSAEAIARMREREAGWLARARALPEAELSPDDRVTRDLFVEELAAGGETAVCRFELWSVSPRSNALVDVNFLPELHALDTEADGAALLARYRAFPAVVDATIANLRAGRAEGLVANRTSLERVLAMLDAQLAAPLDEWPLLAPTKAERDGWAPEARAPFDEALRAAVADEVAPALTRYRDLIRDELLPEARGDDAPGLASLPLGEACYEALVASHTTLPLDPEELHRVGLEELEGIHAELRELGAGALGTSELPEIFERLREDPELRFATADEVRAEAEAALEAAEGAIDDWFGVLPQADCVVEPVPAYEAPFTTIAYYRQPSPDGARPGTYYVNTHAPESRPRFEARVLAYHESVPGHHLQIAIAQELRELPAFRRHGGATAFVEGWGLYSERLAGEMGLYATDLDRLGVLSFDAWRAARLVVDTGLHHHGWSRQQALDFFRDNTPLALNNVDNEVDRYVTTPGQALAYKVGQREILALRAQAAEALGEGFDLAAFHDVVLGGGAVSLPVLRRRVEAWVADGGPSMAPPGASAPQ